MPYYKATIDVLVEVDSEAEACDAIAEALRPMLKEFSENPNDTAWVDWQYHAIDSGPIEHDGKGFEYADPEERPGPYECANCGFDDHPTSECPTPTENESADMKHRFKEHFRTYGYNTSLPAELKAEADANPLEWGEACEEYEREEMR